MRPVSEIDEEPTESVRRNTAFASLSGAARNLLDIVLPPVCLGCASRIMAHNALCPKCWRQIDFVRPPLCDRLGLPMPYDTGGAMLSAAAVADPPDYDRARAVARFDGKMRDLIHAFKFHDNHNARGLFGRWLMDAGRDLIAGADVIVPIPLARWRLLSRRFNQAQILASEIGRRSSKPVKPFALQRSRSTKHQIGLSKAKRLRNVAGAFQVSSNGVSAVAGKAVLLIDDVITSGATAGAAAKALKRAGASRVDILALAIVSDTAP
ncbi:ComF family protein [Hyphomicrobium methylovorum]|uniref:ComF family protein n=1 Tax=Hyphomicrobium methylovorum TaxID=84 RepID=UPI0015E6C718|nr:ComF family protein [Hyphomicrobium methylovorum]MBA2126029.1 ComF family protein [Hyphomicrobium methylovorum]